MKALLYWLSISSLFWVCPRGSFFYWVCVWGWDYCWTCWVWSDGRLDVKDFGSLFSSTFDWFTFEVVPLPGLFANGLVPPPLNNDVFFCSVEPPATPVVVVVVAGFGCSIGLEVSAGLLLKLLWPPNCELFAPPNWLAGLDSSFLKGSDFCELNSDETGLIFEELFPPLSQSGLFSFGWLMAGGLYSALALGLSNSSLEPDLSNHLRFWP